MDKLISVLIPAYNVENYIGNCLDSVINNTYKNLEIICIDDGSTDHTLAILEEYVHKDSRIRVFSRENRGVANTRNELLDHVRGDYVAFVDSDDIIHRQYFEVLLDVALASNADITICPWVTYSVEVPEDADIHNHLELFRICHGKDAMQLNSRLFSAVHCRLFKSNIIKGRLFDPELAVEDTPFNMRLIAEVDNLVLAVVPIPLYYYYQRPGSISHTIQKVYVRLARLYYDWASSSTGWAQYVYSVKALKTLFTARYEETVRQNDQISQEMQSMIRKLYPLFLKNEYSSVKEKSAYFIFAYFPSLYRKFRIKDDPTLLEWENTEREKNM